MKYLLSIVVGLAVCFASSNLYAGNGHVVRNRDIVEIVKKQFVPAVLVETFAPHNRITDELVIPVTNVKKQFVKRSNNSFRRRNVRINGRLFQQIIVNGRVVQQFRINNHNHNNFNQFRGYGNQNFRGYGNQNFRNFNQYNSFNQQGYGNYFNGFSNFDGRVNNQFYNQGALVRQVIVNGFVVAQEIVPQFYVNQFVNAFRVRNFTQIRIIRSSGYCQFNTFRGY